MLSEKRVAVLAVQETALLEDYRRNNNYIGQKVQEGKIEILDQILEIKDAG